MTEQASHTKTFQPWPKIARLNRDIVITEKIDGTNAAIGIIDRDPTATADGGEPVYDIYAQSRTRIITPEQDNFGFARWVADHAPLLIELLGPGLHFGEWWGAGIQRGYWQTGKRFSLFNVGRFRAAAENNPDWWGLLDVVPTLYEGPFSEGAIRLALDLLRTTGSRAVPGFMNPEGIVIYHTAAKTLFKVTLEGDDKPKGSQE